MVSSSEIRANVSKSHRARSLRRQYHDAVDRRESGNRPQTTSASARAVIGVEKFEGKTTRLLKSLHLDQPVPKEYRFGLYPGIHGPATSVASA